MIEFFSSVFKAQGLVSVSEKNGERRDRKTSGTCWNTKEMRKEKEAFHQPSTLDDLASS